jgi:phosphatidylserine decarboxylase
MTFIVKFLPRKWMSRQIGRLVNIKGPWTPWLIKAFAWFYSINLAEAEHPVAGYACLGDFFARKLRAGARPLADSWAVHPADSRISEFGIIDRGTLIQAKGQNYGLVPLIEEPAAFAKYDQGYFVTYYLCPTDYHRVHAPVSGFIRSVTYIPGDLWPVNSWSTQNVPKLFTTNERVYVEIATEYGPVGVVFVGATNVGSIVLPFALDLQTNQQKKASRNVFEIPVEVAKGSELGTFRMGSTVVLLMSPEIRAKIPSLSVKKGSAVRVGTALLSI